MYHNILIMMHAKITNSELHQKHTLLNDVYFCNELVTLHILVTKKCKLLSSDKKKLTIFIIVYIIPKI